METTASMIAILEKIDQSGLFALSALEQLELIQHLLKKYNEQRVGRPVESLWPDDQPPDTLESTIEALIKWYDNPELERLDGVMYQLWCDLEITLQQSGHQMWKRVMQTPYLAVPNIGWVMPHTYEELTYAAMECSDAIVVRSLLLFSKGSSKNKLMAIGTLRDTAAVV